MKQQSEPVQFWNRGAGLLETEAIFGEAFLRFAYENPLGRSLTRGFLTRRPFSQWYGRYQASRWSARAIPRFVERYRIAMDEYESGPFRSFNDFFIRRFKPGARPFASAANELPAFAEGRYLAIEKLTHDSRFPVKGMSLTATQLIGDARLAERFEGGPAYVARLCPTDYHRFHYPDDGRVTERRRVAGPLHSVALIALRYQTDVLFTNERQVDILRTEHFGDLAYIAVGAMCVGKIVDSAAEKSHFKRGDEKGYFLFGGSTVVLLGEPKRWCPDADLLEKTQEGRETFIRLGERIGHS